MFKKQELLNPPRDLHALYNYKLHFERSASTYIKEIFEKTFNVENVSFEFIDDNTFAHVMPSNPTGYTIKFGEMLTYSILNFTEIICNKIGIKFKWDNSESLKQYIFSYICWFILNHELAHISWGHLDYISKNGIRIYDEINGTRVAVKYLSKSQEISKKYWHALESEADANSISTTFISLEYIITAKQCRCWHFDKKLEIHGTINSLMFYLLDILMNESNNIYHPKPYIRQYLSIPSIGSLAEKLNHNKEKYIDIMIKSNFETIMDILQIKLPHNYISQSIIWMRELDDIIRMSDISSYRRV